MIIISGIYGVLSATQNINTKSHGKKNLHACSHAHTHILTHTCTPYTHTLPEENNRRKKQRSCYWLKYTWPSFKTFWTMGNNLALLDISESLGYFPERNLLRHHYNTLIDQYNIILTVINRIYFMGLNFCYMCCWLKMMYKSSEKSHLNDLPPNNKMALQWSMGSGWFT